MAFNPFTGEKTASPKSPASPETVRKFVRELADVNENLKSLRDDLKVEISENEDIAAIDEKIKALRDERKELIANHPVMQGHKNKISDATEDKRQLISDAKADGVPQKEIDLATRALKKDIDIEIAVEVYSNIADLVD